MKKKIQTMTVSADELKVGDVLYPSMDKILGIAECVEKNRFALDLSSRWSGVPVWIDRLQTIRIVVK